MSASRLSDLSRRIRDVVDAPTDDLRTLLRIGGLDPATDLRFQDWSDASFRGEDLSGFDFTGARLLRCDFSGAKIKGARFDQAVIDTACADALAATGLWRAADWPDYDHAWRKPTNFVLDGHLRPGDVFCDSPYSPRMVVIPPGRFMRSSGVTAAIPYTFAVSQFGMSQFGIGAPGLQHFVKNRFQRHDLDVLGLTTDVISWAVATEYVSWLSARTGRDYRLLSESEWEYCFDSGPSGSEQHGALETQTSWGRSANLFGLYHLEAGRWDWCDDHWHSDASEVPANGEEWYDDKSNPARVLRANYTFKRSQDPDNRMPGSMTAKAGLHVARLVGVRSVDANCGAAAGNGEIQSRLLDRLERSRTNRHKVHRLLYKKEVYEEFS
ncbi:MAG: SUMF1/EgtB/PvdO family nonheme iron enzyme [Alphaproteobacteria bacterium]|nr:SUMF1/EgtB/PvdO family nonheme iron enzyme [Alphaproteobacteria bacterium]